MNSINFIHTVSAHEHAALKKWYTLTLIMLVTLIVVIAIAQGKQLYVIYQARTMRQQLHQQRVELAQFATQQQTEQIQEQRYKTMLTTLENLRADTKKTAAIAHALAQSLVATGVLIECTLTATTVMLTLRCQTIDAAADVVHHLAQTPGLHNVHLASITPLVVQGIQVLNATVQGSIG